ncbi:MAG TPA: CoA-binding protein [Variovorax sp.]|nr:CoA-binding protein [Variovorax sp.]
MQLDALFSPRSVAVIGASQNPQKVGGMPVQLLQRLGYAGTVYPVNPGAAQVQACRRMHPSPICRGGLYCRVERSDRSDGATRLARRTDSSGASHPIYP